MNEIAADDETAKENERRSKNKQTTTHETKANQTRSEK